MKKNILKIILLIIIDQIIKFIVVKTIGISGKSIELIPNLVSLTYLENAGAAFGIINARIFLIALDILIVFIIIKMMVSKKYQFDDKTKLGMAFIVAGGIGNLIDRVFRGAVIDYIDISNIFEFPIFNFSDICIIIGVILIFVLILINTVKSQEEKYGTNT